MISRLFIIFMLIVLAACDKNTIKHDALPSGAVVLAFGDSITFGYGASKGQDYPTKLATITGWNIINAGISGEQAAQGRLRIEAALQQYQPKMVLIELGGNDFLKRRDPKAIKEDLRFIIEKVKAVDAIPVLVAVPTLSASAILMGRPSDAAIYKELAKEEQITLIKSVISDTLADESLRFDQIHPNAMGYQNLAEGVAEQLRKSGLLF